MTSNDLLLYPLPRVPLTPHQRIFALQEMTINRDSLNPRTSKHSMKRSGISLEEGLENGQNHRWQITSRKQVFFQDTTEQMHIQAYSHYDSMPNLQTAKIPV